MRERTIRCDETVSKKDKKRANYTSLSRMCRIVQPHNTRLTTAHRMNNNDIKFYNDDVVVGADKRQNIRIKSAFSTIYRQNDIE